MREKWKAFTKRERLLFAAALVFLALAVLLRFVPGLRFSALLCLCAAAVLFVLFVLECAARRGSRAAVWGRRVLRALLAAGFVLFAALETMVIRGSLAEKTDEPVSAVIVLGAGVNGSTPSLSMCNRLDAALAYLNANPAATVIVSGGQGPGEDITEAKAMADYLTAHGIDSARIVQEDRSRTTRENLENSFAILRARGGDPADGVGIVTSEYHLYRAKRMARSLGADPAGIAAETTLPSMRINYFIREAVAAAYMQLAGTLY